MTRKITTIKYIVGDFHMGPGAKSPHEDFKYHPLGIPMEDTKNDYVLDQDFYNFVDHLLLEKKDHPNIQLYIIGDTFDFSAIYLKGRPLSCPYQETAVEKLDVIMKAHPIFFKALKKFCSEKNTILKLFIGNHDLQLHWTDVQDKIVQYISPKNPEKVFFPYEEYENGTYYRHGESEPHTMVNHRKPILTRIELAKLPEALKKKSLGFVLRDILDVPVGHWMRVELMYHLKEYNYLIGRVYAHGILWSDGIKTIGRRSWYKRRWFEIYGSYYLSRFIFRHLINDKFWHIKMKLGSKQFLQVLYYTTTGVFTGHTPRRSAMKVLNNLKDVECVIYGHDHQWTFEILEINKKPKTYINTGTWILGIREKTKDKAVLWDRFRWLQKSTAFLRNILKNPELELIHRYPVGVETIDNSGKVDRGLFEWDKDKQILKKMS